MMRWPVYTLAKSLTRGPPYRPVADGVGQTIRAGVRQAVEQGVVRGADRTAQISPPRPAGVDLHKGGGELQEVFRLHDTLLRLFSDF